MKSFRLLAILALVSFGGVSHAYDCRDAVGDWLWDTRQMPTNLSYNGQVQAWQDGQSVTGFWRCTNSSTDEVTVYWSTGYVDRLNLAYGGQTLQGYNNAGMYIVARRGVSQPSPTVGCQAIVGYWDYDLRRFPATFYANGTVQAFDNGQPLTASWNCEDPYAGRVVIYWSSGITDHMTITGNGNSLDGYNSLGSRVVAWRRW